MRAADLFAGGGGMSEGAARAGMSVVYAANHNPMAVAAHETAHPDAVHICQDLRQADFTKVPAHDILLASPCCQGHAKARGKDTPAHDASRATAWAVPSAVEAHAPPLIVVENVPEIRDWGPTRAGKHIRDGSVYRAWCGVLEAYGYTLTEHVFDSVDVGTPQHRRRLFIVGSLDGPVRLDPPTRRHVNVREVIDVDSGSWSPVYRGKRWGVPGRERAANTISRHEHGKRNVGPESPSGDRYYLCPYYGNGSGKTGRSLDRPCGALTTRARWSLHDGETDRMRMLTYDETLAIGGFRPDYFDRDVVSWTDMNHLVGNAVDPNMAEHICAQLI